MNVTTEQLAEILAGISRAQTAIIEAIESAEGGWRNTHLLPKLTTAANLRLANARLTDIPVRVLLRNQTRVPMPAEQILKDLNAAISGAGAAPAAAPAPKAAAPVAAAAAAAPAAAASDDDLNFFNT
jgi:hypothetical protein